MPRKKNELPGLQAWLKCPMCDRRDYRYSVRDRIYLCKVCGSTFWADFDQKVTLLTRRGGGEKNV